MVVAHLAQRGIDGSPYKPSWNPNRTDQILHCPEVETERTTAV